MSTFESFQTGLMAGQKQAKVRREDDARQKAADAFGKGNYEGAVSSLMGVGLMDDADAYQKAGDRHIEKDRTETYANAFKTGLGAGPAPVNTQQPKGTVLPPDQEAAYQQWINKIGMTKANGMAMTDDGTGLDYDMRGFFQKYGPVDVNVAGGQHFTDEFKLPNHKTFSNESKYAVGTDAARAGRWNGDTYMPAPPPPPSAPNYRGGYDAVRQAAAEQGDITTMTQLDGQIAKMDATQAAQFKDGMEFLGQTAISLKNVPPEMRGQVAMEILQKTPYANPQVLAQIQQAAADGRITDEELDNFAQQTMSLADRLKASKPQLFNTGQSIVSVDPRTNKSSVLYQDPQRASGSSARLRPATPQEAEQYGPPGTRGQIDDTTGRFYPTARPNPQTGGLATEGERKFGLYAKTARDALGDIEAIEFPDGLDEAKDDGGSKFERGNQMNPFDEKSRKYDQAIDRFLDGWSRAMTGAAMTVDEKNFYYGIMKPTFGDNPAVRKQKAVERRAMVERLKEAAARGYKEPQSEVIMPENSGGIDLSQLTPEQLDQLEQQLSQGGQ